MRTRTEMHVGAVWAQKPPRGGVHLFKRTMPQSGIIGLRRAS